jgi:hypothetical protein
MALEAGISESMAPASGEALVLGHNLGERITW